MYAASHKQQSPNKTVASHCLLKKINSPFLSRSQALSNAHGPPKILQLIYLISTASLSQKVQTESTPCKFLWKSFPIFPFFFYPFMHGIFFFQIDNMYHIVLNEVCGVSWTCYFGWSNNTKRNKCNFHQIQPWAI